MITENYQLLLKSEPDFVVVYLGTNDAKKPTWEKTGEKEVRKNFP
jgi:lysophospholipase L1-like esterase